MVSITTEPIKFLNFGKPHIGPWIVSGSFFKFTLFEVSSWMYVRLVRSCIKTWLKHNYFKTYSFKEGSRLLCYCGKINHHLKLWSFYSSLSSLYSSVESTGLLAWNYVNFVQNKRIYNEPIIWLMRIDCRVKGNTSSVDKVSILLNSDDKS